MTDIVERMKDAACTPNTGCISTKTCVCDIMDEAADCIEELREQLDHANYILRETQEGWDSLFQSNARLVEENRKLRVEAGYD